MRMCNFWAQNGPFAQIRIFSENLLTWTLFLSFMLSTCQNSKWDINLLVKYWQLKNSEILLAKSHWEPYFSQVCSFCRTLMNHKNFHLTQILDKTNDLIFLQSPKTLFLCHFWPFLVILPDRDFLQKIQLSHTSIYGPLTACWVSQKTNEPIPRKLLNRRKDTRKDGWKDGHTLFYRSNNPKKLSNLDFHKVFQLSN